MLKHFVQFHNITIATTARKLRNILAYNCLTSTEKENASF